MAVQLMLFMHNMHISDLIHKLDQRNMWINLLIVVVLIIWETKLTSWC
jgi:hypothetical protein